MRRSLVRGQELLAVEREQIMIGMARHESCRVIAGRLGRNHSIVSQEIARNGGRESYRAGAAQDRAERLRTRRKTENWKRIRNCMTWWQQGWRWNGRRGRCRSGCVVIILRTWECGSRPRRSMRRCSCKLGV